MPNFLKILFIFALVLGAVFFVGIAAIADEADDHTHEGEDAIDLPAPGLTPDSPFYFFERIQEAVQEFVTRDPEAKARLGVRLAAERIAEIKAVLEEKGVEARGLDVAQKRLEAHAQKVSEIIEKQKEKGIDVSVFAGEITDKLHEQRVTARRVFEEKQEELVVKRVEIQEKIADAVGGGDTRAEIVLEEELERLEKFREKARERKETALGILESHKERLRKNLNEIKRQEDEARDRLEFEVRVKKDEELRIRVREEDERLEEVRIEFKESRSGSSKSNGDSEDKASVSPPAPAPRPATNIQERIRQVIPREIFQPVTETKEVTDTKTEIKIDAETKSGSADTETKDAVNGEESNSGKSFDGSPPMMY